MSRSSLSVFVPSFFMMVRIWMREAMPRTKKTRPTPR